MAHVDAVYRFRVIQVGDFGRTSDGGVYAASDLGKGMADWTLSVPPLTPLLGVAQKRVVPFTMVGDSAFPLKPYLLYPGLNLAKWKIASASWH